MSEAFAFGPMPLSSPELSRLLLVHDGSPAEAPAPEVVTPVEPTVRAATHEDIGALVQVELSAYDNVYGKTPTANTIAVLEQKYRERVDLLGRYVRVLETPADGVYGMIVCCPTNLTGQELANRGLNMTDNDVIRKVYDPTGENGYIVNLAIRPDKQAAGESAKLFADAIQLGLDTGVKRTYFESRLPGLKRWVTKRLGSEESWSPDAVHALANEYWQATRTLRSGAAKPIDPLLRAYVGIGARPLKLVKDAWTVDTPSQGYGVLCEFAMPTDDEASQENAQPGPEATQDLVAVHAAGDKVPELLPNEEIAANPGFLKGIGRWVKKRKMAILVGGAVAGTAFGIVTGGGQEIIEDVKENAPWVVSAYTASMAAYFGSAATMLAKAGQSSWRRVFGFGAKNDLVSISDDLRKSPTMKGAFWINSASAVSAAGVATAGIIETLPPTAWSALAIPALDLYSTVVLRTWFYGKVISKK